MPTDKQIDAATDAYLKARGWNDDTIKANFLTRAEVRGRMVDALKAAEAAADVQNAG
ncbi:hypothetical protein KUL72_20795 [Bradyrhizobium arachidis]|uniref:hypothetical protein n=1 Tax=Bradyrhizobium arachidis TaxID=858423 RepID=UPI002161BCD2|nr:hypothetical protein [Bradyrhizobium arachidis]UVO33955.1 hypothetical protein KUL72_20795 [Bradyrhizobium arachidis]